MATLPLRRRLGIMLGARGICWAVAAGTPSPNARFGGADGADGCPTLLTLPGPLRWEPLEPETERRKDLLDADMVSLDVVVMLWRLLYPCTVGLHMCAVGTGGHDTSGTEATPAPPAPRVANSPGRRAERVLTA